MADLLVGSAWKTLSKSIRQEQAYDPAAISVLHTWNQRLEPHWHAHFLVPGEGPAIQEKEGDAAGWKVAQAPPEQQNSDGYYLVNAARLKTTFRKRAIRRLRWLRKQGKLNFGGKFASLQDDEAWEAFIEKLEAKTWVVFIQPPPQETTSARQVVNYLTRYLTGGPISDYRITAADEHSVTFLAREGTRVGGERKQIPITLSLRQFVQRWCLHILPEQLTKTRYFGGWSNNCRDAYLARCRVELQQLGRLTSQEARESATEESSGFPHDSNPPSPELTAVETASGAGACEAAAKCSRCGSHAVALVSERPKPSWREVFWQESETCPTWYAELQREEDRLYWMTKYGVDPDDYDQQWLIESAEDLHPTSAAPPAAERQLLLPGLTLETAYETISF